MTSGEVITAGQAEEIDGCAVIREAGRGGEDERGKEDEETKEMSQVRI
jgi:hypothetical protein